MGNIFPSIHPVNMHKNWEELGLTVVYSSIYRKKRLSSIWAVKGLNVAFIRLA